MRRRNKRVQVRQGNLFRILFLVLLLLSIVRAVDLLLPEGISLQSVFSHAGPVFDHTKNEQTGSLEPRIQPGPLRIRHIDAHALTRGIDFRGKEPRILIYHTHTTEAYTATKASPYEQTSSYRTADASKSVLAVGEALANRLRMEYGFTVLHDTTNHEPPSLKTAYERSETTIHRYLEQYPSLILLIDVHRDASSDTSDYVMVDGIPTARLMCVVGQGTKYKEKPDFERNYALASSLTQNLRRIDERLCRDVRVKTGRYNQHIGQLNLLIEVGHNANTLEQALHAVPSLAESLALALDETGASGLTEPKTSDFYKLLIPHQAGIDKE
jgi:stage II sporulation protein P